MWLCAITQKPYLAFHASDSVRHACLGIVAFLHIASTLSDGWPSNLDNEEVGKWLSAGYIWHLSADAVYKYNNVLAGLLTGVSNKAFLGPLLLLGGVSASL